MNPMHVLIDMRNSQHGEVLAEEVLLLPGVSIVKKTDVTEPDIFFLDNEPDAGCIFDRIRALKQDFPKANLFVFSSDSNPEHIVKIMQSGASEFFLNPVNPQKLQEALKRVNRQLDSKTSKESKGTTYAFISSKGGLGASMLAVNTAATLASRNSGRSALIDLSMQAGDCSALLDVIPKATILDIAKNFSRLDASLMGGVMEKHSAGIDLLAAPPSPQDAYEITSKQVQKILALSSSLYRSVVIDCPSMVYGGLSLEVFRMAEKIILVTDLSVPAIRNASRLLKLFQGSGYAPQKIEVVANRYSKGQAGTLDEVEKSLGRRLFWLFPNDFESVMASINRGTPLLKYDPRSTLARNILEFVQKLQDPVAFPHYRGAKGLLGKAI